MPAKLIRLQRKQDKFITDPMPEAEAKSIMAGYPGEYEVMDDGTATAAPTKPKGKSGGSKKKPPVTKPAVETVDTAAKTGSDIADQSEDGVD